MKAWCIWCEVGDAYPKSGYAWIHPKCFEDLCDISDDMKTIKEFMEGKRPSDNVEDFLSRMADFRRRWEGSMELIKKLKGEDE